MSRPIVAAVGAALAALLLSSCATREDDSSEGSEPASASTASAVESETAGAAASESDEDDSLAEGAVRPDRTTSSPVPEDGPRTVSPNARPYDAAGPPFSTPLSCSDPEALAAQETHEPAGWPAGVAKGEYLPDPECHPDFISAIDWQPYYGDCWHPVAHGTVPSDEELEYFGEDPMTVQERRAAEWEASEVRSWWTPPGEGESCSESGPDDDW